jgi:DNA-binding MarR family transcriptional regulator
MPREAEIPLARLFAIAYRSLIDSMHMQLRERGYQDVGTGFGYVLLLARERPLTGNDVAQLMGMTKQGASKLIDALERAQYLERYEHPEDARSKLLRITAKGRRLLSTVEQIYAELEREWAQALGARSLSTLRRDLTRALRAMHGGKLPPVRPTS